MNSHPGALRAVCAIVLTAVFSLAGGCSSVNLDDTRASGASAGRRLSADDRVFALQAAGGGLYEVEAGRLAVTRAASAEVRSFGQMLVDHHTGSNAELVWLLRARGVPAPPVMPAALDAKLARLLPLTGDAFDRQFIQTAGIADHRQQIALFQQASRDVADPALRAWFAKTLPSLSAHLESAQAVAGRIGG